MSGDRKIDSIIIHCADTREDDPTTAKNEEMDIGVKEIEDWHKQRALAGEPWSQFKDGMGAIRYIGYHYVVRRNGVVERARPVAIAGCHCKGHNKASIAVCWVGRHKMSLPQKQSLARQVAKLCVHHGLDIDDVHQHCDFSTKTCPNFGTVDTFESIEKFRIAVLHEILTLK